MSRATRTSLIAGVAAAVVLALASSGGVFGFVTALFLAVGSVGVAILIWIVGAFRQRSHARAALAVALFGGVQFALAIPLSSIVGSMATANARSWCEQYADDERLNEVTEMDGLSVRGSAPNLVWFEPNKRGGMNCVVTDPNSLLRYHVYDPVGERWHEVD